MNLQELTQLYDFTGKTAVITGGTGVLVQLPISASQVFMLRQLLKCFAPEPH